VIQPSFVQQTVWPVHREYSTKGILLLGEICFIVIKQPTLAVYVSSFSLYGG
jgi:hypothetical protein